MNHLKRLNQQTRGSILLLFLITLPFLILIVLAYTQLSLTSFQVSRLDQLYSSAQLTADAGADHAIQQISQDNNWPGTGGEVQLQNDGKVRTTYTASVSGDDNAKTIAVTGKAYWPVSATTPRRSVSINVDLRPVTSANYSVIAGAGGLYMSNNSKVVSGSVFVNGELVMSNSASIGLLIDPVSVKVAHQLCPNPPDSTYPRVCNSGENGQPIDMTNTAHIYGEVQATNQTDGSQMSNPGLVAGSAAPEPLPTYDRAAQQAAISNNMTGSSASCSGSQSKTWPVNTKITGDVKLNNTCTVTVQGDVWITGKLELTNSTQLIIPSSVGSVRPRIMVDSNNGINFSNASKVTVNNLGTGAEFYAFYSTASCSPDCTSVTGVDLANSRSIKTISLANSASGKNSIFYAYWSQAEISNSGEIGAVIGQTIKMSNAAAITFGVTTGFGGDTVWVLNSYRKQ